MCEYMNIKAMLVVIVCVYNRHSYPIVKLNISGSCDQSEIEQVKPDIYRDTGLL